MITFKALERDGSLIRSAITPFTFPAGEAHVKYEERRELEPTEIAILTPSADSIHTDLFHLAMWNDHIGNYNHTLPEPSRVRRALLVPYFPGARADRGTPFGLGVYADFIESLQLDHVGIFDPHSDELVEYLEPDSVLYPHDILPSAHLPSYDGIVAPDKGARGRAGQVANALGLPLITAEKRRNFHTGKLEGYAFNAPDATGLQHDILPGSRLLVVDDICDGGGTFMLLANAVKATGIDVTLDLYVSHPVFSGSAPSNLLTAYDHIYTTNSYLYAEVSEGRPQWDRSRVTHINVVAPMLGQIVESAMRSPEFERRFGPVSKTPWAEVPS